MSNYACVKNIRISDEVIEAPGLKIIRGKGGGRYPYCNTIILGEKQYIIVDPHSRREAIKSIARKAKMLLFTHYHTDHFRYHELINSEKLAPEPDKTAFTSIESLARHTGMAETVFYDVWLKFIRERGWTMPSVNGFYRDGDVFSADGFEMVAVHLPGHTQGHSGFFIPHVRILFTTDIDFTDFGPWYGNKCSSIEKFIESIEKIKRFEPEIVVTSHERWVIKGEDLPEEIERYVSVITKREEKILHMLNAPKTAEEIAKEFPIYGKAGKKGDFRIYFMELQMVKKHLERLKMQGLAEEIEGGKYVKK